MRDVNFRLRNLSLGIRLGITFSLLIILVGIAASAKHIFDHHANRDEQPGLTMTDLQGAYHGVRVISPMLTQLQNGHPSDIAEAGDEKIPEADRNTLIQWLQSDRISEDYDNLDLGDSAPAEIIDIYCLDCHSPGSQVAKSYGQLVRLDNWGDVKNVAFSRSIEPTSIEILTTSIHTHALSLAMLTIIVSVLVVCTSWPRRFINYSIPIMSAALLIDIGSQWLARYNDLFVWVLAISGSVYGIFLVFLSLAVIADLWRPVRAY